MRAEEICAAQFLESLGGVWERNTTCITKHLRCRTGHIQAGLGHTKLLLHVVKVSIQVGESGPDKAVDR